VRNAEAIFVTDELNRQNMILPLGGLVTSIESHLAGCIKAGLPAGMPSHLAHDQCRPVGWSIPHGVYIAKDKARQVGQFWIPESDEEWAPIKALIAECRRSHVLAKTEPYLEALEKRLAALPVENATLWHGEATGAYAPNLAASLVPELFAPEGGLVDKDGLTDYAALLTRTRQIEPGVFHDARHDVLLFAHPYFRRSLSRRNSLNQYVLRRFDEAASNDPALRARLRLDPDLIGVPGSAQPVMELEYWGGPKFNDDLAKIPSGVSVHKSTEAERLYSRIDETHIWWKPSEDRADHAVRTFEVEELLDAPSPGLDGDRYGCRYAHAEFHLGEASISHFDGAIRAYETEAFLERREQRIHRAGKRSDYTKLFRFDGTIPTPTWKSVLTAFYRGNHLIPEYLGAELEGEFVLAEAEPDPRGEARLPDISAYIGLDIATDAPASAVALIADQRWKRDGRELTFAETGEGQLAATMGNWADRTKTALFSPGSTTANLARIALPGAPALASDWAQVAAALAGAIDAEVEAARLERVSLAVVWQHDGLAVTLSIAGEAPLVAALLRAAVPVVDPGKAASDWAEAFRDALVAIAPDPDVAVAWPSEVVSLGKIVLPRPANFHFQMRIPEDEQEWMDAMLTEQTKVDEAL